MAGSSIDDSPDWAMARIGTKPDRAVFVLPSSSNF
jgi:hypothetical protein